MGGSVQVTTPRLLATALLGSGLAIAACSPKHVRPDFEEPEAAGGAGTGGGGASSSSTGGSGGVDTGGMGGAGGTSGTSGTGGSGGTAGSGGKAPGTGGANGGGTGGEPSLPDRCELDSDCESPLPVCDPFSKSCVECLFDADCDTGRCDQRVCAPALPCDTSSDCTDAEATKVCHTARGQCVECLSAGDCDPSHDCVDNRCLGYEPCEQSQDCAGGTVCDTASGRCAECATSKDCAETDVCSEGECVRACESDRACTSLGLLCDFSAGHCVQCVDDSACPAQYFCDSGECRLDECVAGSARCRSNSVLTCRERGDGYEATACGTDQTCTPNGFDAACEDWVCPAGQTLCDEQGEELITCSSDGLSVLERVDCLATNQVCFEGECRELECVPNATYCAGGSIRECSVDGLSSTLIAECSSNHVPVPSCTGAVCDGACEAGFMDCNNDKQTDGCEVDTTSDPNACGACGAPCSGNHVQARACVDSECSGTCAADYDDCNDDLRTDGCETHLLTSRNHCGACGAACGDEQVCVDGDCSDCNSSVLWLKDDVSSDTATVVAALEAAGLSVTPIDSGVITYTGSPAASEFGVVLLSPGNTWDTDMPAAGQQAIVDANAAGVGVVMTAWAGYHVLNLRWATLNPLVLIRYATGSSAGATFTLTEAEHPIWQGLPASFTSNSVGIESGPLINGGVAIASCSQCSDAGVAVRDTAGRVAQIAHAGNYTSATTWYLDTNLLTMFANAAKWATRCF